MKDIEIIFVRHGETDWNKEKRLQGSLVPGPSLNEETGQRQSVRVAEHLRQESISLICSSPLKRCLETAEEIKRWHSIDIIILEDLKERSLGKFEGSLCSKEVKKALNNGAADVEYVEDVMKRCCSALRRICEECKMGGLHKAKVVVVTHGGFLHALHRVCEPNKKVKGTVRNCAICRVLVERNEHGNVRRRLLTWDDADHLKEEEICGQPGFAFGGGEFG
eukprot:jgi/Picsp_1/6856/NSC_04193-R1_phosphoglycerate mutase